MSRLAVSSRATSLRAAIAALDVTIGDITLSVADRSPDSSDATIVKPERMSLEAAREAVPFAFGIPTEIPDGLAMDEQVRVNDLGGGPFVEMQWTKPGGGGFSFTVRQDPGSSSWLVGLDSYREIEIGGEPAVIVTGGWDADSREWASPAHTTLIWTGDGVQSSFRQKSKMAPSGYLRNTPIVCAGRVWARLSG